MDEELRKMFEVVTEHDRLCDACKYQYDGCSGGVTGGPNGPIYPPCCDSDPEKYVDEDYLRETYEEIVSEGGRRKECLSTK